MNPVRFSSLKWMSRSPAHYRWYLDHPPEQSRPMRLGSAVDALRFGHQQVRVAPCATRRGKAWDEWAAQWEPDTILLTPSESEVVNGMVVALASNAEACDLLHGATQETIRWTMAGRECSGTPDVTGLAVTDLKSCRNAHPVYFCYDARKLAYHVQLDWYRNGMLLAGKPVPKRSCIVAVENTPPHVVTIFELTEQALLEGRKLWTIWFEQLRNCEASNVWPGYVQTATPFDVPDSDSLVLKIDGEDVEV